jgi:hypothetical protein
LVTPEPGGRVHDCAERPFAKAIGYNHDILGNLRLSIVLNLNSGRPVRQRERRDRRRPAGGVGETGGKSKTEGRIGIEVSASDLTKRRAMRFARKGYVFCVIRAICS